VFCEKALGVEDGELLRFSDAQWARIERLLPRDTRGMPRMDVRRVLSGIVHALQSGGRWGDCPEHVFGPKKTPYNRFARWPSAGSGKASSRTLPVRGCAGPAVHRQLEHQGSPHSRRQKGALAHGIGTSCGGNARLHAICDSKGRPHRFDRNISTFMATITSAASLIWRL